MYGHPQSTYFQPSLAIQKRKGMCPKGKRGVPWHVIGFWLCSRVGPVIHHLCNPIPQRIHGNVSMDLLLKLQEGSQGSKFPSCKVQGDSACYMGHCRRGGCSGRTNQEKQGCSPCAWAASILILDHQPQTHQEEDCPASQVLSVPQSWPGYWHDHCGTTNIPPTPLGSATPSPDPYIQQTSTTLLVSVLCLACSVERRFLSLSYMGRLCQRFEKSQEIWRIQVGVNISSKDNNIGIWFPLFKLRLNKYIPK